MRCYGEHHKSAEYEDVSTSAHRIHQLGSQSAGDGVALVLHGELALHSVPGHLGQLVGQILPYEGQQLPEQWIGGLDVCEGKEGENEVVRGEKNGRGDEDETQRR